MSVHVHGYLESHKQLSMLQSLMSSVMLPNLQVRRHVEGVMKVVELDVLRDSLVGVPGQSGLSVEARKRLSIAVEQVRQCTWCTACQETTPGGYGPWSDQQHC